MSVLFSCFAKKGLILVNKHRISEIKSRGKKLDKSEGLV